MPPRGRKGNRKGNRKGKQDMYVYEFQNLVNSVNDIDIEDFECPVPSNKEMDDMKIPLPNVRLPNLQKLGDTLDSWDCDVDLEAAWKQVNPKKYTDFSDLLETEQIIARKEIENILKTKERVVWFKKLKFLIKKREEEEEEEEEVVEEEEEEVVVVEEELIDSNDDVDLGEIDSGSHIVVGDLREIDSDMVVGGDGGSGDVVGRRIVHVSTSSGENEPGEEEDDAHPPVIGTLTAPNVIRFPIFADGDHVNYYEFPFSLKSWLKAHNNPSSRWLDIYQHWSLQDKDKFEKLKNWKGCRLRRECLMLMQSLPIALMEFHNSDGPHGQISDAAFTITQLPPIDCGGVRKIIFKAVLNTPDARVIDDTGRTNFELLTEDMKQVAYILRRFIAGRDPDHDLGFFFSHLTKYPFSDDEYMNIDMLRNHPGLWDGQERASFILQFYAALTCDLTKNKLLEVALDHATFIRNVYDWVKIIPPNSIYHDILTHTSSDTQTSKPQTPKPQYQSSKRDALRYMRAVIYHHRAKDRNTDLREVEMCLSQLFVGAIPSIYGGMCLENIFL